MLILPISPIPYQFSYRFLGSSLSSKKWTLHSLLHQKQPFYFFPKLCLHKTVNMNIFNSNILNNTLTSYTVERKYNLNKLDWSPAFKYKCFSMLLVFAPLHDITALHWLHMAEFSSCLVKCSQALDRFLLYMMLPRGWRSESLQVVWCKCTAT